MKRYYEPCEVFTGPIPAATDPAYRLLERKQTAQITPMPAYSSFIPHYDLFPRALFDQIAKTCTDSDIIVEVGAFLGHGTCYLAEQLAANGKRPKFYAIDIWDEPKEFVGGEYRSGLMPWGEDIEVWRARGGSLYDSFRFYLDGCPHKDRLYDHVQFPASTCMQEFADNSVRRVILSSTQDEVAVQREVTEWWPKLVSGGEIMITARADAPLRSLKKA